MSNDMMLIVLNNCNSRNNHKRTMTVDHISDWLFCSDISWLCDSNRIVHIQFSSGWTEYLAILRDSIRMESYPIAIWFNRFIVILHYYNWIGSHPIAIRFNRFYTILIGLNHVQLLSGWIDFFCDFIQFKSDWITSTATRLNGVFSDLNIVNERRKATRRIETAFLSS